MPNRILKESIKTSRDINKLSWFEEVFFYRLIVSCDDYGRYDGDPLILKNTLFPTKDNIPVKDIEEALVTLGESGLVARYMVADERMVLQILGWKRHQNIRAKKSKYPPPPADDEINVTVDKSASTCTQMRSSVYTPPGVDNSVGNYVDKPPEHTCMQMRADDSKCSRNPIQSNTDYENPIHVVSAMRPARAYA